MKTKKISIINRNASWVKLYQELSPRRKEVFNVILTASEITSFEVAEILKTSIHNVVGRVTELCELGLIKQVGVKINPKSKRVNTTYSVNKQITIKEFNKLKIELSKKNNNSEKYLFKKCFIKTTEGHYLICDASMPINGIYTTKNKSKATIFYYIFANAILSVYKNKNYVIVPK